MRERVYALGFLVASGVYLAMSLGFPLGTVAKPGPGFFPVGVGVFLCVAAGALTLTRWRGVGGATGLGDLPADARARVGVTMLGLAGFALLLPWLGYPVCAFLFVAVLLRRLGRGPWLGAVITAVFSAVLSYYLFGVLLGVPLPRGPF